MKTKLPEGTTVEAVLEGPAYEKGSEIITGMTNYKLKVRTTLNGKVSEHTYKVPHIEEPSVPTVSDEEIRDIINKQEFYYGSVIPSEIGGYINEILGKDSMPNTPEHMKEQSKDFEVLLKKALRDKVSEVHVDLVQILNVGDGIGYNFETSYSVFSAKATITKLDGTKLNIDIPVITAVINSL